MKKILGRLTGLAIVIAFTCQAADYSPHMYQAKIYRVALGSGSAPSAADAALVGIKPGDMVENTDDNVLYVMTATNAYVKVESDGTISSALASNKIVIGNSSGAGVAVTLSGDVKSTTSGILTIQDVSVADNDISLASGKIIVGNAGGTGTAVNVSGDIDLSNTGAMTIKDVSVADNDIALASSYMLVGNAGGTGTAISVHGDASMDNAGALSVTQLNSIAVATITAGATAGATALQPGVCGVSATTNAGVATVLVTNSLASQTVMCGWLSTNAGGFATAVNLTSIAVDGNSVLLTAADNPSPIFRTHTDGKTTFTITFSAASTNCFNVVQRDGAIKSSGSILPSP